MNTPFKLKINLENMPLSIYRKVLVPEDINMMQMHFIIQIAMGWRFAHLFRFSDAKGRDATLNAGIPDEEFDNWGFGPGEKKADKVRLKDDFYIQFGGKHFWYWYDFGDDWRHKINFQKPTKKDMALYDGKPVCVDAFGACPPEDVGGPWGYSDF